MRMCNGKKPQTPPRYCRSVLKINAQRDGGFETLPFWKNDKPNWTTTSPPNEKQTLKQDKLKRAKLCCRRLRSCSWRREADKQFAQNRKQNKSGYSLNILWSWPCSCRGVPDA